jgi:hypothetical protein
VGQNNYFLKNEPEKLLKIKIRPSKTNPNEPKNEPEKLLKTRSCGKNEAKNEAGHVVESKASVNFGVDNSKSLSPTPNRLCWPHALTA